MPANPMDQLGGEYDRWFDSAEGKELFGIELACIQNVLNHPRGRWLEVGVGTGRFASALGIHEGIDPSEAAISIARSRGVSVCQATAEDLPYADASLDGVLLVTTLCFLGNPQVALHEFQRALKPGGRLVMGVIPADSPWGRLYAEKARQGHPFYAAAHFHTVDDVLSLARQAGFTFERASSCLLNPPDTPQAGRTEEGIVAGAGFVCLGFCDTRAICDPQEIIYTVET